MIHIGTAGYSYDDWQGPFYPPGLGKDRFFAHYIEHFSCVELNFTYYRQPEARTLARLVEQTPSGFRFALKAFQDLTLGRSQDPAAYATYLSGLEPILEREQLAAVLLQFPNSFRLTRESVDHLRFIRRQWPDLPLVVEFRHSEWVADERTFEFLRGQHLAFCAVDEPALRGLMPAVVRYTGEPGYVRFHGRNADKWYHHQEAWERYNYLYNEAELRQWLPRVRGLAEETQDTYLFFNNHYGAKAVKNAQDFARLLTEDV